MLRILSLDGGGIKGAFSASVLAALEEETNKRIVDYFDLIVGTSTGGIIAIGLGLGKSAAEIVQFYRDHGPTIFPATGAIHRPKRCLEWLCGPKHSRDALRDAISSVFGDRKLGNSSCRLVIPTYDTVGGRIFLLKTAHHERLKHDYKASAVDVALATSAAPTYFKASPFPEHQGAKYIDGGVWANSPAMVGICEAHCFLNVPIHEMHLLSIGTTTSPFNVTAKANAGLAKWSTGIVELLFNAQVDAASAQAGLLLGDRYLRINSICGSDRFKLDNATPAAISELIQLGRAEALKRDVLNSVTSKFINSAPVIPFVPFYMVP